MLQLLISALLDNSGVANSPVSSCHSHILSLFHYNFEEYKKEAGILCMLELVGHNCFYLSHFNPTLTLYTD